MLMIAALKRATRLNAVKNYRPMQPGDVPATAANTDELKAWIGFQPNTAVKDGVARFVAWYWGYHSSWQKYN